eukprot:361958-Chlamydomonas_euryale.AAC.2
MHRRSTRRRRWLRRAGLAARWRNRAACHWRQGCGIARRCRRRACCRGVVGRCHRAVLGRRCRSRLRVADSCRRVLSRHTALSRCLTRGGLGGTRRGFDPAVHEAHGSTGGFRLGNHLGRRPRRIHTSHCASVRGGRGGLVLDGLFNPLAGRTHSAGVRVANSAGANVGASPWGVRTYRGVEDAQSAGVRVNAGQTLRGWLDGKQMQKKCRNAGIKKSRANIQQSSILCRANVWVR